MPALILFQRQLLKVLIICFAFLQLNSLPAYSQDTYCIEDVKNLNLQSIPGKITAYYSPGQETRAQELKSLLERAAKLFEDSLDVKIEFSLAALNTKDWNGIMDRPYGLPCMRPGTCKRSNVKFPAAKYVAIMPGAINGPLYDSWIILKDSVQQTTVQTLHNAGLDFEQGGKVLIDFVGLHEVAHAYAHAFGINYYVNLFAELMADYLAYAFLRSTPERMDLKVMPVLAANVDGIRPVHSTFGEYENFRSSEHPPTEAWYNSVITLTAAEIYEQRGFEFLHAVRKAFTEKEGQLKTDVILQRLENIHPGILKWAEGISAMVRVK